MANIETPTEEDPPFPAKDITWSIRTRRPLPRIWNLELFISPTLNITIGYLSVTLQIRVEFFSSFYSTRV